MLVLEIQIQVFVLPQHTLLPTQIVSPASTWEFWSQCELQETLSQKQNQKRRTNQPWGTPLQVETSFGIGLNKIAKVTMENDTHSTYAHLIWESLPSASSSRLLI